MFDYIPFPKNFRCSESKKICILITVWISVTYITDCRPGSVVCIATTYGLDGPGIESHWGGARFSAPVQTDPGTHQASCTMGTGCFPGVKSGQSVTLTPHSLLLPLSRKSRAIRLLPLWAVRPVQSRSACTRVQFTFTLYITDYWFCDNESGYLQCASSRNI